MKRTRVHQLSGYLKISCTALLVSGTIIGYGFTHNTHADSTETSRTMTQAQDQDHSLSKHIKEAKDKLNHLKDLSKEDIKDYQTRIDRAKDDSKIDAIIEDARQHNEKLVNSTVSNDSNNDSKESKELDQFLADLDAISNNVDNYQPNNDVNEEHPNKDAIHKEDTLNNEAQDNDTKAQANDTTIFKKLDSIKDDVDSLRSNESSSTSQSDKKISNQAENNERHNRIERDIATLKSEANQKDNTEDKIGKITKDLQGSDKITHALAQRQSRQNDNSENYLSRKLNDLGALESKVKEDKQLSDDNKQKLKREIDRAHQKLDGQQNAILYQLKNDKDKAKSTENILRSIMSNNEAQRALKNIKIEGQSDKDIANQIAKQIDGVATTSSDDILKSMLDQSRDKEKLIKELLSTRLGNNEASQIAKKLANGHLSQSQIVEQLKRYFDKNGHATTDDILNGVLNNAKNKKEAIETILATRLNQDKAKILAGVITRIQNDKTDALQLIQSALNGKANDLLQLQNRAKQAKGNLNYILSPIKDRPSLLDRIHGNHQNSSQLADILNQLAGLSNGSSLLDGLNSRGSLLDGIGNIDTPTPESNLSLGSGDGLLSGLLNDDGNISLPATGKLLKHSALPLAIIALVIGSTLIWVSRRKNHHAS
ncbi:MAG: cell wall anchor protein [Staphylococcaceae bacterium]|uniref:cell wall anchor protein n=1 Tax=Staphylococcus capitis TaxID=29388 RepID=UPI0034596BA2|nr:cell wall anchor protein [Staphylococcaceae bacterium]MBW4842926.1 cell wall anchor protein [Staphylococcaceae bacterium]